MAKIVKYELSDASRQLVTDELEKISAITHFILDNKVLKDPSDAPKYALAIYQKTNVSVKLDIK